MERKVKYNLEFKFQCVHAVLVQHQSIFSVSKKHSFNESLLRKWIVDYEHKGVLGLRPRSTRIQYSQNFKLKVIQAVATKNLSLKEARIKFNLPTDSIIIKWQKDFSNFGADGLLPKPKGRPKLMSNQKNKPAKSKQPLTREEELLLENERLRCENALLKKFNALMQAEEERLKKPGRKP